MAGRQFGTIIPAVCREAILAKFDRDVLTYGPSRRIQTWALEEARRRLEVEGILEDPEKKL